MRGHQTGEFFRLLSFVSQTFCFIRGKNHSTDHVGRDHRLPSACCTPRSSVSESRPPLIKNSSHVHRLQPRQTRTFELQKNKYFSVSSAQCAKPDGLVQPPENPPQLFPSSGAERVSQHLYLGSPAARKEMREMPGCPLTSSSRTLNQFLNWVSCQVMEQALLYRLYALFQTVMVRGCVDSAPEAAGS